jgi:hypothetical protein
MMHMRFASATRTSRAASLRRGQGAKAPLNPANTTAEFASLVREYGIQKIFRCAIYTRKSTDTEAACGLGARSQWLR